VSKFIHVFIYLKCNWTSCYKHCCI